MRTQSKIVFLCVALGLLTWFADAFLDYHFSRDATFLGILITNVPLNDVFDRVVNLLLCVSFGVLAARAWGKREAAEGVRRAAEERIQYLNVVLRAIRNVNQLITRAHDRDELIRRACRSLTDTRGYLKCWIALLDDSGRLTLLSQAKMDDREALLRGCFAEGALPSCARAALERSGLVVVYGPCDCPVEKKGSGPDPDRDAQAPSGPTGKRCLTPFSQATLVVPLRARDTLYGLLAATEPRHIADDPEVQGLFREVADDLALALQNIAFEERHLQDEEEMRSLARFPSENPDAILRVGADGTVLYANAASEQVLSTWKARRGERAPEAWRARVAETLASGVPIRVEEEHAGRVISFELAPVPQAGYVNLYGRDITPRKQAEKALREAVGQLRESEERLRAVVEDMPGLVCRFDSDGVITFVNDAYCKYFGKTPEELIGHVFMSLIPPQDRELVRGHYEALTPATPTVTYDHRVIRKDTQMRWQRWTDRAIFDDRDRLVGYQSVGEDITERRDLEEQFRQAQKMEAVGRLAGGVAHDFNNLLTAIMGYSEMLLRSLDADDPMRKDITEIHKAGMHAALLTRQLLAFSRRQVLDPRVLDLNAVVLEMENILRRVIGEDVELVALVGADLGRIRADPGQTEQVIMNLAVNARDAMPSGGTLTIGTANFEMREADPARPPDVSPGEYVMLSVADTGHGMDSETLAHVFEPFFTTKPVGEGTGLGLSTVYGIVKQSGGDIRVESQPGRGTTFRIWLPRVEDAAERPRAAAAADVPYRGTETILVAEDEEVVRTLICETLRRSGYDVIEATGGADALRACGSRAGPIHMVITDVVMPQMSGFELGARIAQARPEARVLYVSGYPSHPGVPDAAAPGADTLWKPFTIQSLTHKVREMLDQPSS